MALIDHNAARILIALADAGLAHNTIVIYISDDGDWLRDHGVILKGPMHYDGLLRVPFVKTVRCSKPFSLDFECNQSGRSVGPIREGIYPIGFYANSQLGVIGAGIGET